MTVRPRVPHSILEQNILARAPRAPEYARLLNEYHCNGAGSARGARLVGVFYDALATVKRLEIELAELRDA